jgi:uncharacterized protein YqeY
MQTKASLAERISSALTAAMKARDAQRTSAIRMMRAAVHNREIDKRSALTDEEVMEVLSTMVKQRRESIEQFRAGKREDLVAKEEAEVRVIQEFLPQQLSADELRKILEAVAVEVGARGPRDLGKVMSAAMPKVRGRAEGRAVNEMARAILAEKEEK